MGTGKKYLTASSRYGKWYAGISEKSSLNESALVDAFLSLKTGVTLTCVKGEEIFIVSPGTKNRYDGPDISSASIFINGIFIEGDVECHISEIDWFHHSHNSDDRYNNVILHVLLQQESDHLNLNIPTVVLPGKLLKRYRRPDHGCTLTAGKHLMAEIDILATRIWSQKVAEFYREGINNAGINQHFLRSGFKVIGGKGNGSTMVSIADDMLGRFGGDLQPEIWSEYVIFKMANARWNSKNVRPAKRQKNIQDQAVAWLHLLKIFHDEKQPITTDKLSSIVNKCMVPVCGKGTIVELYGNILYPFLGSLALGMKRTDEIGNILSKWKKLKLSYTYNYIDKQFNPYFSKGHLRLFFVLQALIRINSLYCSRGNCIVCPLILKK